MEISPHMKKIMQIQRMIQELKISNKNFKDIYYQNAKIMEGPKMSRK
jgi:hypothetical protein